VSGVSTSRRGALARWPLLSVATLLTYNTWAVWRQVNGSEQIINGYLSELSASDQPHNLFFRGGDLLTALIMGAVGVRALRVWPHLSSRRRWWYVAAGGLLLFALSTFLDSFFSMDCSPTLSASCKVLEETGRLSAIHYAHTYTSVGAQAGIVASMVGAYIAVRRSGLGGRWRSWLLALCVVEVGSLVVLLVMLAADVAGIGYPQAVTVVAGSVWFAAAGVALARRSVGELPPTRPREETLVH
jgi:hypothetical protein